MNRVSKTYGLILSLTGFALSINILPPLVTTFSADLNIPFTYLGFAFSLQYISFFLTSLLYGFAVQKGLAVKESIILVALIITAITISFLGKIHSYFLLLLFLSIVGGCGGIVESSSSTLISEYEKEGTSRYLNLSQFFYCLGAIISPVVVALMFSWNYSISDLGVFFGISLIVLVGIIILILILGEKNIHSKVHDDIPHPGRSSIEVFKWYILAMFIYVIAESSLASWIPLYFEQSKNYYPEKAAFSLSLFWVGLAIGRLYYSFKKTQSLKIHLLVHALAAAFFLFMITFIDSLISTYIALILIGFSCGPLWPMLIASCWYEFNKPHFTLYLVSASSIGAFIGPLLSSYVIAIINISYYFVFLGICFLLTVLAMGVIKYKDVENI